MAERNEVLLVDRLTSGDKPSTYVVGMLVAHALKKANYVVIAYDALGRVLMLPPDAVELKTEILVPDDDLNALDENEAISIMIKEGRSEDSIIEYLGRRQSGGLNGG